MPTKINQLILAFSPSDRVPTQGGNTAGTLLGGISQTVRKGQKTLQFKGGHRKKGVYFTEMHIICHSCMHV